MWKYRFQEWGFTSNTFRPYQQGCFSFEQTARRAYRSISEICSIMGSRAQSLAWKIWEIINKLFFFWFFLSSGTASEESVFFSPRARWMPVISYRSGGAPVNVGWSLKHVPQSAACRVSRSKKAFHATESRSQVDWFWHPPHDLFWSHVLFVSRDRTNMQWET